MRLAYVLLLSVVACGIASAAPDGFDEKPWAYPDGWVQYRTEYNEQEPNDACPGPLSIMCGDVVYGELTPSGDWDWYPFSLDGTYNVIIGTDDDPNNPQGTDTYLELWSGDCAVILTEDDDGGPGFYSLINTQLDAGDYNIKVRGYADVSTGTYMMFLNCAEPPPPLENDTCEDAEANGYFLERCTAGSLNGDHSTGSNDYSPESSCTGYSVNGLDVVYYMDLNAGDLCNFVYTSWDCDGSFYIITDCADPTGTCVVGADDTLGGEPESILNWEVPETGRYYLVLDNWSSSCGGYWTLDYSIECVGCECAVVITDVLDLGNGRCKYLFYGMTDCDVTNDFHLDLLDPGMVTLIGCSVPPESSWFCDIDGDVASWWTDTNDVPPGEQLPLMDLVVDWNVVDECVPFLARFTLDGVEICSTEICFDYCVPVATEETSWGKLKSMFK
jgi:hypothetical protein